MRERFPYSATKRLGLFHSDGTFTVYASDIGIDQARREAVDFDENQDDPALFTKVVSLRVEDIDILEVPSLKVATKPATDQSPRDGSRPCGMPVAFRRAHSGNAVRPSTISCSLLRPRDR